VRLAFQHLGNDHWAAGSLFLESMFHAFRALGRDCPTLLLFADNDADEREYQDLAGSVDNVVRGPVRPPGQRPRPAQSLRQHFYSRLRARLAPQPVQAAMHPLSSHLLRHEVDAYFSAAWDEASIPTVATVVWIPDFQHVRLPGAFTPEDRASRDSIFRAQAHAATRLLVTSSEVQRDLETFAPNAAAKVRCLNYVAAIPSQTYRDNPRDALATYHLPEKFVYLPNQFWLHKNHKLVFEALSRLHLQGVYPCIVSTGNPFDYRKPAYFGELMQMLSRLNLREQFIFLGQVPRSDVFRLMRQAMCVLNPSLFEGLGMSVAESKSLGKRVLVSDLAPLREQAPPEAVYFDPSDAGDLAAKMTAVWSNVPAGPDREMEAAARAELPRRQAAFGHELLGLFNEARAEFAGNQSTNGHRQ
jgi:glycosyltransferase involved in cell wall biosynthesis